MNKFLPFKCNLQINIKKKIKQEDKKHIAQSIFSALFSRPIELYKRITDKKLEGKAERKKH